MKNKYLSLICFIYSLVILFAWISGSLNNFLAPNMQIFLKVSIIPMVLMGIIILVNKFSYKYKSSDLLLLIPLLMIFLAGDGNLSMSLASNKISGIRNKNNDDVIVYDYDANDIDLDDIYFDIVDPNYSYLANYLTYTTGAGKYAGKTIRVKGFTIDQSEYLNDGYYALGKYSITCCAADAEFAGFVVKSDTKLDMNEWYEVVGVLEYGKDKDGYNILVIDAASITKTTSNGESQYVYTCNSYGDGSCKEVTKYDLEY